MSRELIAHVFANLQALERTLEDVEAGINANPAMPGIRPSELQDYRRAVRMMHRTANVLQLNYAHEDWAQFVRSLHIFYGLNAMVRPSIMAVYAKQLNTRNSFAEIEAQITMH